MKFYERLYRIGAIEKILPGKINTLSGVFIPETGLPGKISAYKYRHDGRNFPA